MFVFVYGTLTDATRVDAVLDETTRGSRPPEYADPEFVGDATLEGLHRADGAYPTLVPGGRVTGRVLSVDERDLEALDAYEGLTRGLYVRARLPRVEQRGSTATPPADDFDVTVSDEPGAVPAGEPTLESSVWTYVGDPDRLGVEPERESTPYWPGSGPFGERVRRRLERDRTVVLTDE
ncbi:gamma-glutamylcyclotransferase family protein [Halostagnicola kamekurae]|uniref:Uncharacterized conserved protein YtfP, gamma-glutamylcyclotransferase (GGCT)/AIG2-like family n=1 Tax=Halostagnicola kamekurae TaxID=619731 RepID=A0A1I6PTK2_9EURY|nr:gamma-glutamylcyclotransferase family protein [Halostagnicola kamekurae]SFS43542.1 Uncharacterized conserved protein YtfP, gamma-glutamylcyclotransferase (GGCT)/AIG2-like family [Halostagnicola kamekurae]